MAQSWPRENPLETRCKDNFTSLSASISSMDAIEAAWYDSAMGCSPSEGLGMGTLAP